MEHRSSRLVAEILQSIERGLQSDEANSGDTESVQNKEVKAWESYMATMAAAINEEYEPPGK
jgi:hypothetical protein